MNIIKIGDSRELLKQLESKSVNAVYFDPPFNSNRNYRLTSDKNSLGFDDVFVDDERCASQGKRSGRPPPPQCKRVR